EQNGSSMCLPCKENEFIEYPNDFRKCLGCKMCREDQVELSACQPTRNTQCACKNGTFCSPDHPCEMCQKCRPRCPKGEVEVAPCTPQSDRRCSLPTDTSSSSSNNWTVAVAVVVPVVTAMVVLICLCKCCCRRSSGDGRDLSRKSCSVVVTRLRRRRLGTEDNIRNERYSQDQLLPRNSGTPSAAGSEVPQHAPLLQMLPFQVMVPRTNVIHRRNLVPVEGKDPINLLRRSFDIFAEVVPLTHWKRYGRALDLLENDIDLAEKNDKYSHESFFQMLNTWLNKQGMSASVNTLLETLHQISLGGIAEDISTKLVQQGFFQYEVS
ncbi:TR10B factor, partial [Galbula dea]|nr:TR10B factor [Galbula dea]